MVREMGGGEMKGRGEPQLLSKRVAGKVFPNDLGSQIKSCSLLVVACLITVADGRQ